MPFQQLTDSIKDSPDSLQVFFPRYLVPHFQMKFISRFVPLSAVERFNAVLDVSENKDKRRLEVPGSERKSRMGVGCALASG
jgi:hypothetical protein